MNNLKLSRRHALLAALGATAPWQMAHAFGVSPTTRLIVPFPAGGGTDVIGRLMGQGLGRELGTTVLVDNVAGATGTIGAGQVARAKPDGRTLLLGITGTLAIAPALFQHLPYDTAQSFTALARICLVGNLVVANPKYPANSVPEMVALAKRSKDPLIYGSWGVGSGGHLAMEAIHQATGIPMQHVPYKGVSPLMQDLIGGQIMVGTVDLAGALPQIRAGKIKVLAITGSARTPALPKVPTLKEGGIPFDTDSWFALFGPAHMPDDQAQKIAQAAEKVLRQPELIARIKDLGLDPAPISRAGFDQEWHADMVSWARLVKQSGATVD
jgi:tripartite-type tricarboxylate transporter receptor subunit TctC